MPKGKQTHKHMPHLPPPSERAQRHKATSQGSKPHIISAAVSIQEPLYRESLKQAIKVAEGNWSRYVRQLIKRDLGSAA